MRFSSVDFPALGSPIRATKPARVGPALVVGSVIGLLHPVEQRARCCLFCGAFAGGLAAGGLASFEPCLDREKRLVIRPVARGFDIGRGGQAAGLRPFLQGWIWHRGSLTARHRRCACPTDAAPRRGRHRTPHPGRRRRSPPPSRRPRSASLRRPPDSISDRPSFSTSPKPVSRATSAQVSCRTSALKRGARVPSVAWPSALNSAVAMDRPRTRSPRNSSRSLEGRVWDEIEECVTARTSSSGRAKSCPMRAAKAARSAASLTR